MNIAAQARAAAMAIEVKKDSVRQVQCGDWRLTLTIAAADMPVRLITALPGTRYQLAIVEIGDDEQPVSSTPSGAAVSPAETGRSRPKAPAEAEGPQSAAPTREAPQRCPTAAPLDSGARAVRDAGMLCAKRPFQEWLFREDFPLGTPLEWTPEQWKERTIESVRRRCGVISRTEFATSERARGKWHAIEVMYFQATGRMAKDVRA